MEHRGQTRFIVTFIRRAVVTVLAAAALFVGAPSASWAHGAQDRPPAPAAAHRTAEAAAAKPQSDAERYAERERQAPEVADFEGGGRGIYIGLSTGAAIVLAAVLLLILL